MKKKIISGMLCLAALFTACQEKQTSGYTIAGTLKGAPDGATVKLVDVSDETMTSIDSTVVKGEKFTIKGDKLDYPMLCRLVIDVAEPGKEESEETVLSGSLYVENSPIQWEADAATLTSLYYNPKRTGKATVTGSAQQAIYEKYLADQQELSDKYRALDKQYMDEYYTPLVNDPNADVIERGIEIASEIEPIRDQLLQHQLRYITEHSDTRVAFDQGKDLLLGEMYVRVTAKQIDEIIAALEPSWGQAPFFAEFKQKAEKRKLMAVGEPIPDNDFVTPEGKTVKLSSVIPKGKYVLLDFWASWCGPCRGGIPHLKNVQKKYPDFNIIAISIDEDEDEWKKALDEEKMTWKQLCFPFPPKGENPLDGPSIDVYALLGVPTYILLDGEGRIHKPGAEWVHLDKFLKETYGK